MQQYSNPNRQLRQLIIFAIIFTASSLLFPLTSASFGPWYGSIAKHIAQTNNWSDLVLANQDWLDKPHFPFWITAVSFKLFGINSFAYILPGLLFHFVGAYYTFQLAQLLYQNERLSLLACLIYLTIFHLMFSAIDVRAEAYLLGQIMPAVYYWLRYDQQFSYKNLILGAFFTGLALMTKGIFVIITIVSGLFWLWMANKRFAQIIHPKWLLALALSFVVATPEFIALYQQFDLHPEKVVFGHTHVSGLRWYFFDSQFGRFFGTGYIVSTNPPPLHQLFFIHTFLWAFLPWSLLYPIAIYQYLRRYRNLVKREQQALIILLGYFFTSFVMFSITSFQVDHYTNIIFPFAAILVAKLIDDHLADNCKFYKVQLWLAILMLVLVASINAFVFHGWPLIAIVSLECAIVLYLIWYWGQTPALKAVITSVLAIGLTCVSYNCINGYLYHRYDSGYHLAQVTNLNPTLPVVDYKWDSRALEFFSHNPYYRANKFSEIPSNLSNYYLVIPKDKWTHEQTNFPNAQLVAEIKGNTPEKIIPNLISPHSLHDNLDSFYIVLVDK